MTAQEASTVPEAARRFIDGVCNFDVDEVAAGLCENARLKVSNNTYATGRSGIRNAFIRALGSVYGIRCEPAVVWGEQEIAIIEADVECERLDRARVAFPLTLVLRFRDSLISDIGLLTYAPAIMGSLGCLGLLGCGPHRAA